MCLFRWRGVDRAGAGSMTVMRLSAMWPRTEPRWPWRAMLVPLEAHVVVRVGVGDVDLAAHRVDRHVEQRGADAGEDARRLRRPADSARGVDGEHVLVGQRELDVVVPAAAVVVDPVELPSCTIDLTIRPVGGCGTPCSVGVGGGQRRRSASTIALGGSTVVWLPEWNAAA